MDTVKSVADLVRTHSVPVLWGTSEGKTQKNTSAARENDREKGVNQDSGDQRRSPVYYHRLSRKWRFRQGLRALTKIFVKGGNNLLKSVHSLDSSMPELDKDHLRRELDLHNAAHVAP